MHSQTSIEIDRPIDEVFRLTTEHMPEWSRILVEDEILQQTPEGVGTTFRTVTADHGRRMEFQEVITQYDPPCVNAVQMTGDMFDIETEFRFEDLGGRTRVSQTADVTGKGAFRVFLFLFGWLMIKANCKASQVELENLKQYCESESRSDAIT